MRNDAAHQALVVSWTGSLIATWRSAAQKNTAIPISHSGPALGTKSSMQRNQRSSGHGSASAGPRCGYVILLQAQLRKFIFCCLPEVVRGLGRAGPQEYPRSTHQGKR